MPDNPCPHHPGAYDIDPDTGDVWCFHCAPPRNISREQREEERVRNVQSIIYDLHQQIADRDRRLEDAYSKLRAQRQLLYRLEAVNADLRQQNAHLLDQPLIILSGEAYIGSRDYRQPCPN